MISCMETLNQQSHSSLIEYDIAKHQTQAREFINQYPQQVASKSNNSLKRYRPETMHQSDRSSLINYAWILPSIELEWETWLVSIPGKFYSYHCLTLNLIKYTWARDLGSKFHQNPTIPWKHSMTDDRQWHGDGQCNLYIGGQRCFHFTQKWFRKKKYTPTVFFHVM